MKHYEETFDDFWKDIVCDKNGSLNVDQVKRELHDYRQMLREVPQVYDHVTGGVVSKPNTCAEDVIALANDHTEKCIEREIKERADDAAEAAAAGGVAEGPHS